MTQCLTSVGLVIKLWKILTECFFSASDENYICSMSQDA